MCPYNAISFDDALGVSSINAAMCQGCGTCVAACPAGAISGTGFSDEQVMAQIEGLMRVGADGNPTIRHAYPVAAGDAVHEEVRA
jgi:heterodisulfide reductase subunit A